MQTKCTWLVTMGLAALLVAGCGAAQVSLPTDASYVASDAARGQAVFQATCATCHAPDGTGRKGQGPSLVPASAAQADLTEAGEYRFLRAKHAKFPKPLTDDQVRDVSAFVISLRKK